ncbi:hypothetical protein ACU4GD_45025 [Cupriavidus basilensis]
MFAVLMNPELDLGLSWQSAGGGGICQLPARHATRPGFGGVQYPGYSPKPPTGRLHHHAPGGQPGDLAQPGDTGEGTGRDAAGG